VQTWLDPVVEVNICPLVLSAGRRISRAWSTLRPPLSAFFKVRQVLEPDDGSLIATYAFDAPQRTRLVAKVFNPAHDTVNFVDGGLISDARMFSPLDDRTGPLVLAIRREHGTPKSVTINPVGISSRDRIRMVIHSLPDDGKHDFEATKGQLTSALQQSKLRGVVTDFANPLGRVYAQPRC